MMKKVKIITISVPEDILDLVTEICDYNGISRSHYISSLMKRDLELMEQEEKEDTDAV